MSITTKPSDRFDLRAVEDAIASTEFAGHLHHVARTTSTSDLAQAAAQAGERHGVWFADEQTVGRGRGGHTWHSAPGEGLYMTALISPAVPMQSALSLSMQVAIAVQSAIASAAGFRRKDQIDIRWPNDLLLNGRKCVGILIDTASNPATSTQPAMLRYATLGIGINVNQTAFPPELESIATSLRRELPDPSQPLRRESLAAAVLLALNEEIRRLTAPISNDSRELTQFSSWISGKRVRVEAREGNSNQPAPGGYTGITAGLDPSGFLRVNGDDGQPHTVLSGGLREP